MLVDKENTDRLGKNRHRTIESGETEHMHACIDKNMN